MSRSVDTLVVFHDHGHGFLRKCLRWGFRHVFVAVLNNGYWIVLDGQAGVPVLEVVAGADFDLAGYYRREHGFTVLGVTAPRDRPAWPLMFGTCVGAVKRVLGLRAPWVLTPYGLYRCLKNEYYNL